MMVDKFLPLIEAKWPRFKRNNHIWIKQYNVKSHFDESDVYFKETVSLSFFKIHLMCQSHNSPDIDVLDQCLSFTSATSDGNKVRGSNNYKLAH